MKNLVKSWRRGDRYICVGHWISLLSVTEAVFIRNYDSSDELKDYVDKMKLSKVQFSKKRI